jgi:hypothetical protein
MARNELQEWCQKRGHVPPCYVSNQTGPPHKPVWRTAVTVFFKDSQSGFFGEDGPSKKEAEASAASMVLKWIQANETPEKGPPTKVKVTKRTAIMVDVENMPRLISQLPVFEGPVTIFAFVGKHHHLASVDYGDEVTKILSPSTRPDGTDTCMQVHAGRFLMENEYDLYLIATRDHFGGALVEMIESDAFCWQPKKAALITSVEHALEYIK